MLSSLKLATFKHTVVRDVILQQQEARAAGGGARRLAAGARRRRQARQAQEDAVRFCLNSVYHLDGPSSMIF